MAGAEAESLRQRRRPAVFGVARKRVNQIEADSSELVLRDFERLPPLACRMRAAEEGELLIVEALQAEREAVDSGCREIGEARRFDGVGIGFERDLDVVGCRPV